MSDNFQNNIFCLLKSVADESPLKTCFIYNDEIFSYKSVMSSVRRLANYFQKRGIKKGDRILIKLGNRPEFIYAFLAASQLGIISVLVNPAARCYELKHYIKSTKPVLVITEEKEVESFKEDGKFLIKSKNFLLTDINGSSEMLQMSGIIDKEEFTDHERLDSGHPAAIIFTSAMEGDPLGAMIPHLGVIESAKKLSTIAVRSSDTFLTSLPLFHAFGLTSSLVIPLYNRIPFVMTDRFSRKKILSILTEQEISIFCGVPLMFYLLKTVFTPDIELPKMKLWISGGESIPIELQSEFKNNYNIDIRQGYGLTEASPIATWNVPERPNILGSIGSALPYNDVKIIKDNLYAKPCEEGEIIIKGINVVPGYYKRPDMTRKYINDGWLHTGDIGYQDDEGYFFITGRKKDMIIRSGLNVYPREVENILRNHPSIKDVRVTGQVDTAENTRKETLLADIYRKKGRSLTQEELKEWCKCNISSYKIPDELNIKN